MRLENFVVNLVPNPSNLNETLQSTCTVSYKIDNSTLYMYLYQNKDMGKYGWLNIYLEDTVERAIDKIEKANPGNRSFLEKLLDLFKKKELFEQLVVVTTLDGVEGIPKYEIYLDNLNEVARHTNSREALIKEYPIFEQLL